jgi:hypothetical protein
MTKITREEFGAGRPKLSPEDLDRPSMVLVIAAAEPIHVEDDDAPDGKRKVLVLRFEETGEKAMYLNKGMIDALLGQFGPETDDWIGQRVPVQRHTAVFRGAHYPKVRIPPLEEWADLLGPKTTTRSSKRSGASTTRARSGQRK